MINSASISCPLEPKFTFPRIFSSVIRRFGKLPSGSIPTGSCAARRGRSRLAMCPFGAGPRNCIGEFLAQLEMQTHL